MKLQHIAIGARFEYDGRIFVKTGPLTASSEQGGQQMIPRYAVLKPLDLPETQTTTAASGRRLDPQKVQQVFDSFYQTCHGLVPPEQQDALNIARNTFLASLKIQG